jgi:hypothetical protein
MFQYSRDRITRERWRINESRTEEKRTEQWFSGQLVMRRSPKPFGIGMDFWFGPYMVDSVAENGSLRTMLPDGETIPVNHRELKEFI